MIEAMIIQNKSIELCLILSIPACAALVIASQQITSALFGNGGCRVFTALFTRVRTFLILVLPRNTPHAIRDALVALGIPNWAIVARFNPGDILKFPGIAFLTGCVKSTTNHFVPGGADFAQRSIGWVGVRLVGTFGEHCQAFRGYKSIALGRNTRRVDV